MLKVMKQFKWKNKTHGKAFVCYLVSIINEPKIREDTMGRGFYITDRVNYNKAGYFYLNKNGEIYSKVYSDEISGIKEEDFFWPSWLHAKTFYRNWYWKQPKNLCWRRK